MRSFHVYRGSVMLGADRRARVLEAVWAGEDAFVLRS
jgi:hypothetical protein